jgi:hypothetical protein
MFWLIENNNQLEDLYESIQTDIFVELILYNDNIHPALNKVSLIYIKNTDNKSKGYIISVNHSESLPIKLNHIEKLFKKAKTIYVRDIKKFLYFFQLKHVKDALYNTNILNTPNTTAHEYFYKINENKHDLNRIIPITKHYEKYELIFNQLSFTPDEYICKSSKAFFYIEQNGLKIDKTLFKQYYDKVNEIFSIQDDTIYSQYNLHTTTGRPSNSFNHINFAALNKENGCRSIFIPRNDVLIEFDISAYHPMLTAKLIDYDFNDINPYQVFAEMYKTEVKEAKILTFQQLYGTIHSKYLHFEFFQKLQNYIDKIWYEFQNEGYITCPSGYKFYKNVLDDMNPQKLFNYLLQNIETSTNVDIIWGFIKILKNKKTKLILYTYDAFLLDFKEDEIEIINEIKQLFEDKKLKIKVKYGDSYNF